MILVMGASSRLGQTVTRLLLEAGHAVRATARSRGRLEDLARLGAECVELDLRKPESFAPALDGIDSVFASAHALTGRRGDSVDVVDRAGHLALIDAAVAAKVERFVYTSAHGARPDHPSRFWAAKAAVEDHLKRSGLSYTIIRPSAFMDLHAFALIGAPMAAGKTVNVLGNGRFSRNLVAIRDLAPVAAEALTSNRYRNATVEVQGPEDMTDLEIIAFYEARLSRPAKVRFLPKRALAPLAMLIGPFHAGVANLLRLPIQLPAAEGRTDEFLPKIVGTTNLNADPRLPHTGTISEGG